MAEPKDKSDQAREDVGVATRAQNEKLSHSDEAAPAHTRQDGHDLGVPVTQGHASEPVGPEDALGPTDTRGDYSKRAGEQLGESPHTAEQLEGGGEPIRDDDGGIVDFAPVSRIVAQSPSQGKVAEGQKGGVPA